jgi:DHA2 family multidrug resistance protein
MNSNETNDRGAWATLTHDSLNTSHTHHLPLSSIQFVFLNMGLLLGNILVLFNTGAFASVSLHATGDLGVSPSHAGWMQSYYFIFLALALPVSTWLANRIGEVKLYIISMLVMSLASLLLATTDNLTIFLFGRMLQGFFGGLTIPLSQTLLLREYPASSKSFAVSLWSMAALSPFTLGPAVGGWLADTFDWRWLFYINVPFPLFTAAIAWALLLERDETAPNKTPFDVIGFGLLVMSLVCLQTVLSQGQDSDWFNSPSLIILTLLGILIMAYFIVWELSVRSPLLDLRLFARRNFALGSMILCLSFMMMYGLLSILLVRLQVVAGYTSFMAGSVLLPLIFLSKPMASILHRIMSHFDARLITSINMLLFALYCASSSQFDFFGRNSWFAEPLWTQVLEGFCLGGLFVPLTTLFLTGLTPRRQTQAVELGGMMRVLGGSIASPLFGLIWERRSAFHQSRLIENFPTSSAFAQDTLAHLQQAGITGQLANAKLAGIAGQHASILGLNDTFQLTAWLFLGLSVLVWLANPVKPNFKVSAKNKMQPVEIKTLVEKA